ncbi:hypothetical protein CBW18_15605 [Pedobacter sp. AJM]|nr:hypothetical protein CBW18_15605 [Pedobacter sp. AJM]
MHPKIVNNFFINELFKINIFFNYDLPNNFNADYVLRVKKLMLKNNACIVIMEFLSLVKYFR